MSFFGGLRVSTSNTSLYQNEVEGDVLIYTGSSNQTLYIGHSNAVTPGIAMTSNLDVKFGRDITSTNVNALGSLVLHMSGMSASEVNAEVEGTIARNSAAASNQTFLSATVSGVPDWTDITAVGSFDVVYNASSSTFASNVTFSNSLVTIGSNANTTYPLHVQTADSLSNISIIAEGDIVALSDSRYKRDLVPIPGALDKMDLINGYTFSWTHNENTRSAGVIAQEMFEVLPEVVTSDPVSGKMHVAYGNITSLLIQGIKELAHAQHAIKLTVPAPGGQQLDLPLPDRAALIGDPSAKPWATAIISPASSGASASGAFARVSDDGTRVQGFCDAPGDYAIAVFV